MRLLAAAGLLLMTVVGHAQQARPLDAKKAKTEYPFVVRAGRAPLTIRVEIGTDGKVGDALVFRKSGGPLLQRFPSCLPDVAMELYEGDERLELVEHADFNFDGFEDLKVLQFYHPHLGKRIYCVYLWDEKIAQFRYEPQIPMPDPVPDPGAKTITSHNEYQGGTWGETVYVWSGNKIIPIAEWGLANESGMFNSDPRCPWIAWCNKRINGKMRKVTWRRTGCDEMDVEPAKCTPPPRAVYERKAGKK